MLTNYVLNYPRDHEYVSYIGVDRKIAELVSNKQMHSLTYRHSTLHITTDYTFIH